MDYGKILSRAWQITWRWKALWIFGFLVSLGQAGSQGGNGVNWVEDRVPGTRFFGRIPPEVVGILIALACVGLIIIVALWVLSVIGRGALIGGVQQVEEEGSTSLGRAWRAGVRRFWTLFGISILTGLPIFILILVVIVTFAGPIVAEVDLSAGQQEPTGIFVLSLCGVPLCCGTIIVAIVLAQIQTYADRAAVLEGKGWIDALRRGWEVLRENIGPTLIFWLIFFGIGLAFAIVIGGGLFVLILPLAFIFAETDLGPWLLLPLACGGLVAAVIGAIINSMLQTFTSATWTLAYREMTGLGGLPPEAEDTVP
jgi:hypothetical protein